MALGAVLATSLFPGQAVGLIGELGAGKTVLIKGLCSALGIREAEVHSPTYTLVHHYLGGSLEVFHADLFRLNGEAECNELELLPPPEHAIAVLEWIDRIGPGLEKRVDFIITLAILDETEREVRLWSRSELPGPLRTFLSEQGDHIGARARTRLAG